MSDINVKLGTDNTGLATGLKTAQGQVASAAKNMAAQFAGAFAAGSIIAGLRSVMTELDNVGKMAERFGTNAEEIQKIKLAADLAGTSIEGIGKGFGNATKQAAGGSEEAQKAFARLNIRAEDFVNMSLTEKMLAVSAGLQNVEGSGERLALVMQLLGRSGAEALPFLLAGPEALKKQFDETAVVGDGVVKQIEEANDRMEELQHGATVLAGNLIAAFKIVIEAVSMGVGQSINILFTLFDAASEGMNAIKEAGGQILKGNFSGAKDSLSGIGDRMKSEFTEGIETSKNLWSNFMGEIDKMAMPARRQNKGGVFMPDEEGGGSDSSAKEAAREAARVAKEAADIEAAALREKNAALQEEQGLREQLFEQTRKNKLEAMSEVEQIAALKKELEVVSQFTDTGSLLASEKLRGEIAAKERGLAGKSDPKSTAAALQSVEVDSFRKIGLSLGRVNYGSTSSPNSGEEKLVKNTGDSLSELKKIANNTRNGIPFATFGGS
jgi:hypothetical protein